MCSSHTFHRCVIFLIYVKSYLSEGVFKASLNRSLKQGSTYHTIPFWSPAPKLWVKVKTPLICQICLTFVTYLSHGCHLFVTFVTNQFIVCPMCQWNDFLMSFKEWRLPNFVRSSQFKCASPSKVLEKIFVWCRSLKT